MPPERRCPVCDKVLTGTEGRTTTVWLKITDEHGFDTIKLVRTCSPACKAKYESRVRESFQESEKLRMMKEEDEACPKSEK